jgi:hypothetical protein
LGVRQLAASGCSRAREQQSTNCTCGHDQGGDCPLSGTAWIAIDCGFHDGFLSAKQSSWQTGVDAVCAQPNNIGGP